MHKYTALVQHAQPEITDGVYDIYLANEADDVLAGASIALNNAKRRIRALEKALRTYGGHKEGCSLLVPSGSCDCGLASLMEQSST